MSTIAVIAIIAGAIVLVAFGVFALKRLATARAAARERMAGEASGHRLQADAHAEKAKELGGELDSNRAQVDQQRTEADRHRAEASRQADLAEGHEEAAAKAEERVEAIEERIPREGRGAAFHDERASDLEQKL